jgi:senataxin
MSLVVFSSVNISNPQSRSFVKSLPAGCSFFLGIVATQIRGVEAHLLISRKQFEQFLTNDTNASSQKLKYEKKRSEEFSITLIPHRTPESGLMSLLLEYRVVTGLVSQWREYLALHEAYRSSILPAILNPLYGTRIPGISPIVIEDDEDDAPEKKVAPSTPPSLIPKGFEVPESEVALGELSDVFDSLEERAAIAETGDSLELPPPVSGVSSGKIPLTENEKWRMEGVGDAFNNYLHSIYNHSQVQAIRTCVETTKGFSLVQGPPGTGKTSTILGLLNAVHIRDYNKYFEALLGNILGPDGLQCRERGLDPIPWVSLISSLSLTYSKPHLLVVAPSNVAVDNIIERIMEKGFRDSSGSLYYPNILRIGSGGSRKKIDSPCRSVTLDESVDTMLNTDGVNCHAIDKQLTGTIMTTLQAILQLQTLLLNLKLCWESHPLDVGWELRINEENGRPYWVDHIKKSTQWIPPTPPPPEKQYVPDFTLQTLPEYKYYTHLIVQKLEELRLLHLRKVRVRVVVEWTSSQSTRVGANGTTFRTGNSMSSLRHSLETSYIEEADIVFTTLNSSGHPCLEGSTFPVAIIDEAGQCVEPSILIPLRMGCHQSILVGDQQQLSATIFSKSLSQKGYDRSLFERLDKTRATHGLGSVMLDTQYRMLPDISKFPSQKFYSGFLKDGDNVKAPGYGPKFLGAPQMSNSNPEMKFPLKPFLFLDLVSSQDCMGDSTSRSNLEEARLCLQLVKILILESTRANCPLGSIGIITPYQEQLNVMRNLFAKESLLPQRSHDTRNAPAPNKERVPSPPAAKKEVEDGEVSDCEENNSVLYDDLFKITPQYDSQNQRIYPDLELNTVDAFQGREKDIVVISCVRSNDMGSIGFLSDTRRMNVAITRARFGLFIVGNATTLRNNRDWNDLIQHSVRERRLVTLRNSHSDILQTLQKMESPPPATSSSQQQPALPQQSQVPRRRFHAKK